MKYITEKFIYYSHKRGLKCLDPQYFNTNSSIKSGEVERVTRFDVPLRVYGYLYNGKDLPRPETGLGLNIYKGKATKLYDIQKDKLELCSCARIKARQLYPSSFKVIKGEMLYDRSLNAPVETGSTFSFFEKFIKNSGFNGYVDYERGVVVLFNKVKVRRER